MLKNRSMLKSAVAEKETPLMKQYFSIKAKYPDAILLFRVGDFYETFGYIFQNCWKARHFMDEFESSERPAEKTGEHTAEGAKDIKSAVSAKVEEIRTAAQTKAETLVPLGRRCCETLLPLSFKWQPIIATRKYLPVRVHLEPQER